MENKSILVIDTPKDCYECPCYDHEGGICQASHNWKTDRENGCPLRYLPQKKDIDKTLAFGGYENIIQESLARGYNACLEEITK